MKVARAKENKRLREKIKVQTKGENKMHEEENKM